MMKYKKLLLLLLLINCLLISSCKQKNPSSYINSLPSYIDEYRIIEFGLYPQTIVSDQNIIKELTKITSVNNRGYIEYKDNEYIRLNAIPFEDNYTFSDGKTIYKDQTYYFKVEPIKWRIIHMDNDIYFLLSDNILDTTTFYPGWDIRTINEQKINPNNYEYSNIRAWLNGYDGSTYNVSNYVSKGFYDISFNEQEKSLIQVSLLDNSYVSAFSQSSSVSNDTNDKIFVLSFNDICNPLYGFTNDNLTNDINRTMQVTDYTIAKGGVYQTNNRNGYWWIRSLDDLINPSGRSYREEGRIDMRATCIGCVPAIIIKDKEI